ncbi:MAG: carboxypeptidase regulatory-like domain-containing protein [Gemmatimonas sp.]
MTNPRRSGRAWSNRLLIALSAALAVTAAPVMPLVSLDAQAPIQAPRVKVRGTIFDSLTMLPAARVDVWLSGGTQTTKSDNNGHFELDDVPEGDHFIAFASPALDSTGVGQLGGRARVSDGRERLSLATPSFATLWKRLCSGMLRAGTDSGIVWGTIRDASNDQRQSNASASFRWYDLTLNEKKRFDFGEDGFDVRTDDTGTYYACGLPTEIRLSTEAMGSRAASGPIELAIGERRLTRLDLLVSSDMVMVRDSTTKAGPTLPARGTARLRGRVVDVNGKDVVGAVVSFATLDTTVRTNQLGEFTLLNLPAGTHGLQARHVGHAPATMTVELRAEQTTQTTVTMASAQSLATVNVRAERVLGIDQQDFQRRLKLRSGYTLQADQLKDRFDLTSALQGMPGVQITRPVYGEVQVLMSNRRYGQCAPALYVDKVLVLPETLAQYRAQDLVAVEVFNSKFSVPVGFEARGCGAVLFWTRLNPRW